MMCMFIKSMLVYLNLYLFLEVKRSEAYLPLPDVHQAVEHDAPMVGAHARRWSCRRHLGSFSNFRLPSHLISLTNCPQRKQSGGSDA